MCTNQSGNRVYVYDWENELIEYYRFGLTGIYSSRLTQFVYDGLGRLRIRIESHWQDSGGTGGDSAIGIQPDTPISPGDGSWVTDSTTRYVYDGRRVIQERDGSNTPTVSYTRGNDLSGTLEEAGGIGGLLARSVGFDGTNWTSHADYFADGNGNITTMIDGGLNVVASYRYDPFGNLISSSGPLASANVYRFSSKEFHAASSMYYYGFRFYDPNLQRWINRDPIEEEGGINQYAFVVNSPTFKIDYFGLCGGGGGDGNSPPKYDLPENLTNAILPPQEPLAPRDLNARDYPELYAWGGGKGLASLGFSTWPPPKGGSLGDFGRKFGEYVGGLALKEPGIRDFFNNVGGFFGLGKNAAAKAQGLSSGSGGRGLGGIPIPFLGKGCSASVDGGLDSKTDRHGHTQKGGHVQLSFTWQ
jgi:RHS repeat-associated protein